ncbi:outer membrane usher protein [Fontimonas thermophila]|uniref:Outer membrane usher protein n=1 Tax=Fontimonas thermophila TaxID=1076937 RepID=A0A1I2JQX1_9GAMM|nr:fimbria/pilus outer membrane usher protein [Fontimonas thermophila]SFF55547.1 outer membrane usher protein [Fontimonas thermophila]
MKARSAWWSLCLGLELLTVAWRAAWAAAPENGWFADDCDAVQMLHPDHPTPLLLRVLVSPIDPGQDAVIIRAPDGTLYAPPEVYAALQLPPPGPPLVHAGRRYHALDRVAGLRFAVDACRQILSLDRSGIAGTTTRALHTEPAPLRVTPEPGGYMQVQAQYLHADSVDDVSALIDAGLFGSAGLLRQTLRHAGSTIVRLDTHWTYDDPVGMTRLDVGDGITRGGVFGRSLRFGGVQWGRDFSLRPDLVTFPLPDLTDAAALPSAIDVYVDGTLRARDRVPAGPFQLSEVPVLSGAGEIQLVITDLLGRSRIVRYAFYAAPELLRPGLSDYTLEAGFERHGYGLSSLDYGAGFAAATWRYGIADHLTVETHVEASTHRQMAGAGYALLLPGVGVLSSGLAQSAGDGRGGQLYVGLDRQGRDWSLAAQYLVGSDDYLRLGETEPATLRRGFVRASRRLRSGASLSLGWIDDLRAAGHLSILSAGYARQIGAGWSVNLGGTVDLHDSAGDSLLLTVAYAGSPTVSSYGFAQQSDSGTLLRIGTQRNPLHELDWSARATVDRGLIDRISAGGDYRTTRGAVHADVEHGDHDALRLGIDTGIVVLGHDRMWTRPLDGPFALVETDAPQPIHVQIENRASGRSRAGAPLLVTDLRPYQINRISVAPSDFGIERRIDGFERRVAAPGYGGVRVRFTSDARPMRRLRLLLPDGRDVPAGADVTGGDEPAFVGLRGETVVAAPSGRHRLRADWVQGGCEAQVALSADDTVLRPPLEIVCIPVTTEQAP